MQRERCTSHKNGLNPGTAFHASAFHKAARSYNIATITKHFIHPVDDRGVVVIISRKYKDRWCLADVETGHDCPMYAFSLISDKTDIRIAIAFPNNR